LRPLLFCLTIQPLLNSLQSPLTVAFMDDFTLGGPEDVVDRDIATVTSTRANLGLNLNVSKCEIVHPDGTVLNSPMLSSFKSVTPEAAMLLGAPLLPGKNLDDTLNICCSDLSRAISRLSSIESHDALLLLRSCFCAPKIQHILRCTPCHGHQALATFDDLLKSGLGMVTNCDLSDLQWLQACLPVRDGGLGIRRAAPLALSAFLASAAGTLGLQDDILANAVVPEDVHVADFISVWSDLHSMPPPEFPSSAKQSVWDKPAAAADKALLESNFSDGYHRARLAAVSAPHSGDWLHAMPISACGLRLDNEAVRIAVGLRLGVDLCTPHDCPCGKTADARGIHGLSCRLAFGRMARHHEVNDLVWRALCKANVPSVKEPSGLVRDDGKRPDGSTLIPWHAGKAMAWDVTVVNTLAESYLSISASPGGTAEHAAARKSVKYSSLPTSHIFQPLAFETLGPINSSGITFLSELGRRLSSITGDQRESTYLFQRVSLAVQRYNSVAFKGTFLLPTELD